MGSAPKGVGVITLYWHLVGRYAHNEHPYFTWEWNKNKQIKQTCWSSGVSFMNPEGQVMGLEGQGTRSLYLGTILPPALVIHLCVKNLIFACNKGALIPYLYLPAFLFKSYFFLIVTTPCISRTLDFNICATKSLPKVSFKEKRYSQILQSNHCGDSMVNDLKEMRLRKQSERNHEGLN